MFAIFFLFTTWPNYLRKGIVMCLDDVVSPEPHAACSSEPLLVSVGPLHLSSIIESCYKLNRTTTTLRVRGIMVAITIPWRPRDWRICTEIGVMRRFGGGFIQ